MPAGRPKNVDEATALERAMNLFWARGYEAVGLSELVATMGIARQSLYSTYGSKRGLFLRAIELYRDTVLVEGLALLGRPGSPLENVKATLYFFEVLGADERGRGCFLANSLVEVAPHDEELAELISGILGLLESGLVKALEASRACGELDEHKSPIPLARALMNSMIGMAVTGRIPQTRALLSDISAGTLNMLD